jgi:protein TonB
MNAHAQEVRTYPYKTTEYWSADGEKLPGPEGAKRRLEYTYRDSLSGTVRTYSEAGKLYSITPYAHIRKKIKLGPETTYYESGELRTKQGYVGNKREGEFVVYYPDGKLKRREQYENDVRTAAECLDHDGKPVEFFEFEVMPTYQGQGLNAMVTAIMRNVRYPKEALMKQTQGRVYVSFDIGTTGEVQQAHVVKGVSPALDAEALRAVNALHGCTPGRFDGELVPVSFTVPVTFRIQ